MNERRWPDELQRSSPAQVEGLLRRFWQELAELPDLIARDEQLLCAACTERLRATVLEMMLALNGIAYPQGTSNLNTYLSPSQRAAIEKTLLAPSVDGDTWIGQAVALVVIYRWYAPQLAGAFALTYDGDLEMQTLDLLRAQLWDWPAVITTD
jgi:hypothetical protein